MISLFSAENKKLRPRITGRRYFRNHPQSIRKYASLFTERNRRSLVGFRLSAPQLGSDFRSPRSSPTFHRRRLAMDGFAGLLSSSQSLTSLFNLYYYILTGDCCQVIFCNYCACTDKKRHLLKGQTLMQMPQTAPLPIFLYVFICSEHFFASKIVLLSAPGT